MIQHAPSYFAPLPSWLMRIVHAFADNNFRCYLVGGAVRDRLRQRAVYDYDLSTDATPTEMMKIWKKVIPVGIKYGTLTFLSGAHRAEVTTFRSEEDYQDGRHPDKVRFGTDIVTDLSRRDFTINAIAYDPLKKHLLDPFGGFVDINCRIIRTVGKPEERFAEDALRILRAVRFATTLDFTIDKETAAALIACASRVRAISAERIREELKRIIISPRCAVGFSHLARLQLIPSIFTVPELAEKLVDRQDRNKINPLIVRYLHMAAIANSEEDCGKGTMAEWVSAPMNRAKALAAASPQKRLELLQEQRMRWRHVLIWYAFFRQYKIDIEHTGEENISPHTSEQYISYIDSQLRLLCYPNEHRKSVVHLVRMLNQLPSANSSDSEVRHFFFNVGAQYMYDIQYLVKLLEYSQVSVEIAGVAPRLLSMAQSQRIFSYRDLAIDGNILQQVGYERGKKIGSFMKHAVQYVCTYPECNTRQHLTERARAFLVDDAPL